MSTKVKREERYIVFNVSDVVEHLTTTEALHLARLYEIQRVGRKEAGKSELECVVVEKDWPEYEPTWQAIEARVTGAQAQPALNAPEGWKLVPIKPTPVMKTAGIGVEVYQDSPPSLDCLTWEEVEAIYTAMIEVAPEPETKS